MISPAIIEALAIAGLPEVTWKEHDDECDCTFQRICQWTNPYMGTTHEERLCCVWAKLHEMFPGLSRDIPAWYDFNEQAWVTEPMEWNGEDEMPKAVWYRHLARKLGRDVSDIREEYAAKDEERPKGKPVRQPIVLFMPFSGEWVPVELTA